MGEWGREPRKEQTQQIESAWSGYSGPILSPGPIKSPCWLVRHAWDTVDLFYPHAIIVTSYDMPGIQWIYSIPGPLVALYDMPGIQWTYSIPGPLVALYNMPGIQWVYSIPGPLVALYDMPGIQWTYSIPMPL